jgi:hypothetical protein
MTKPVNDLQATLARLARMSSANARTEKKQTAKFFKPKPGKNNLLVLPTPFTGDPFNEWGTHKNLLAEAWRDVACVKHNKGEECIICSVVDDLKAKDWRGNFNIWKPLELKIRYFSPVIDLDNIDEGVQWWGYGKTVLSQFETWLLNLEEGEVPFYDINQPEKVILNYNKEADPMSMYKLDKKLLPKAFTASQNEIWAEQIKPLTEVFTYEMPADELMKALEQYLERVNNDIAATDTDAEEEEPVTIVKKGKLDSLRD